MHSFSPRAHRAFIASVLSLAAAAVSHGAAHAQYFGRNKVQYEDFDFRVLRTEHFDLHYYPEEAATARDAARMAERWYARLARTLSHEILSRQPFILYADHADFQQTNVIDQMIDESTGGVTEGLQRRVVLPATSSYRETDHVVGHELVHAFQYDIANKSRGGGMEAMGSLPLWVMEGMAEYLSVGRTDAHTAMWLRDAVLHDDIPTLNKLARDARYFPYRFGQAVWAYIGGKWGDQRIVELYRQALSEGWERAVPRVLGVSADSLSKEWVDAVRTSYQPLLKGRSAPDSVGRALAFAKPGPSEMMLAPSVSPDGRYVAFLWARDFSIDLYLADARTGKIAKRLASGSVDAHSDAVSFMGSAGAWSPDGRKLAFVVFARGDNELAILDVASADVERRIEVPQVGAIASPSWSPDGKTIAFSGAAGGVSDLFLLDVATGKARRVTNDKHADLQPTWSPDGRTIAFASDRDEATDFARLSYGPMRIALLDVASGNIRVLELCRTGHQINPQFSPDGRDLYFLASPDGFRDLYRTRLETGEVFRITNVATGITGLTALSPAFSVGAHSGEIFFSVFDRRGQTMRALDASALVGEPLEVLASVVPTIDLTPGALQPVPQPAPGAAGRLPPVEVAGSVEAYLADARTGMPDSASFSDRDYSARPRLSYVGMPTLGVGTDRFGVGVYANAEAYFTDVLGDHGLIVQGIANGSWKDVGGQAYYESRGKRWNWGVGAGHIPYVLRYQGGRDTIITRNGQRQRGVSLIEYRERYLFDQGMVSARYPLSASRRIELSGGFTRIGYDFEVAREVEVNGRTVDRQTVDLPTPDAVTLWQAGAALVGDYSVFGIASPIQGGRYRFEVQPTAGSFGFVTALADWRRYAYSRPVTLAVRALHYGRYGPDADRRELGTLFLGTETLVRGYDYYSFGSSECTAAANGPTGCAQLDRLFGSRLAVGNIELRLPLIGTDRFGLLNFRFLPTEVAAFVDGGVAWTADEGPSFDFSSSGRTPVFSTGLSARFNLFGAFIVETFYAIPFQRSTGGRFGIQLAPGW